MMPMFVTAEMIHELTDDTFSEEFLDAFPEGAHWAEILAWLVGRDDAPQVWSRMMTCDWATPIRPYYDAYWLILEIADQELENTVAETRRICKTLIEICDQERDKAIAAAWQKNSSPENVPREVMLRLKKITCETTNHYQELISWLEAQYEAVEIPAKKRRDDLLFDSLIRLARKLKTDHPKE